MAESGQVYMPGLQLNSYHRQSYMHSRSFRSQGVDEGGQGASRNRATKSWVPQGLELSSAAPSPRVQRQAAHDKSILDYLCRGVVANRAMNMRRDNSIPRVPYLEFRVVEAEPNSSYLSLRRIHGMHVLEGGGESDRKDNAAKRVPLGMPWAVDKVRLRPSRSHSQQPPRCHQGHRRNS